jgi:chromosome segregation ATPase
MNFGQLGNMIDALEEAMEKQKYHLDQLHNELEIFEDQFEDEEDHIEELQTRIELALDNLQLLFEMSLNAQVLMERKMERRFADEGGKYGW